MFDMSDIWFEITSDGAGGYTAGQWVDFNPTNGGYPPELMWQSVGNNEQGVQGGWPAVLADDTWVFSPPPPPTAEEVAKPILFQRDQMALQVSSVILQLQCLAEAEETTSEEKAELATWKQYVRDLARINEQPGFPYIFEWPNSPDN
jgi:hypothetical protein